MATLDRARSSSVSDSGGGSPLTRLQVQGRRAGHPVERLEAAAHGAHRGLAQQVA